MARCIALIGMVSTHVLPDRDPDGSLTFLQGLAGGRSAALFAVLAGVSLAFMTGRQQPVRGRERVARSAGIAVRALIIAAIGLLLGLLSSGLAVILTYYGLLFLVGLLFVGLRARALFVLAAAWIVVAPALSHVIRPQLPRPSYANPSRAHLSDLPGLLSELTLTGYYPVLPWVAYLLAGLGVGRLDLTRRPIQVGIAGCGAALSLAAAAVSRHLTAQPAVVEALLDGGGPKADDGPELLNETASGMFGVTPAGGPWEWLLVVSPHSSTPFDLAQTIGSSLFVIGSCLLVVGALDPTWMHRVAILFGAGTMTLSLYTLHVVMRTPDVPPEEVPSAFPWHVVILMTIGALFVLARRRGPLEWIIATASARTATIVRRL